MAGSRTEGPPWVSPVERQLSSRPWWRATPAAPAGRRAAGALGAGTPRFQRLMGRGVKSPGEPASPGATADPPGAGRTGRRRLTPHRKPFSADERDCGSSVCTGLRFRLASGWLLAGRAWRGDSCFSSGWPQRRGDWELYTTIPLGFPFQQQKTNGFKTPGGGQGGGR